MNNYYVKAAIVGAVGAFGGLVIKKLNDIQAEIEHLESANNVWSLKTVKRIEKQRRKEERQKEKDGES